MDDTRALLDELMGRERNVPLTERSNRRIRYDDPVVCKYDIAGLCPHGLFKNTRSDLGPCTYEMHSDHLDWPAIQEDYDRQDDREKERFEKKLMRYLEELIREMDRKIAKCKDRAERESAPKPVKPEDRVKLDELQQRAREALAKSQRLGEEGDVDAALVQSQQAELLKKQHEEMLKRVTAPDKTMEVCDICGVFINSTDNEERRWDHLNGKQYLGWKAIREQFAKLQEKFSVGRSGAEQPELERTHREKDRERERSPRRDERPREDRYRDERYRDDRGSYDRGGYDRGYDRGRGGGGSYRDAGREGYSSRGGHPSYGRPYEDRRRY